MPKKASVPKTKKQPKPVKPSGNCVMEHNEIMYLISYDDIYLYSNPNDPNAKPVHRQEIPAGMEAVYEIDPSSSQAAYEQFKESLISEMSAKCPSLKSVSYIPAKEKNAKVIMANKLFEILLKDNEWSLAVRISPIEDGNKGIQTQTMSSFAKNLRDVLLDHFPVIYVRTGSFMTEPITKDSPDMLGNMIIYKDEDKTFGVEENIATDTDDEGLAII